MANCFLSVLVEAITKRWCVTPQLHRVQGAPVSLGVEAAGRPARRSPVRGSLPNRSRSPASMSAYLALRLKPATATDERARIPLQG